MEPAYLLILPRRVPAGDVGGPGSTEKMPLFLPSNVSSSRGRIIPRRKFARKYDGIECPRRTTRWTKLITLGCRARKNCGENTSASFYRKHGEMFPPFVLVYFVRPKRSESPLGPLFSPPPHPPFPAHSDPIFFSFPPTPKVRSLNIHVARVTRDRGFDARMECK